MIKRMMDESTTISKADVAAMLINQCNGDELIVGFHANYGLAILKYTGMNDFIWFSLDNSRTRFYHSLCECDNNVTQFLDTMTQVVVITGTLKERLEGLAKFIEEHK